MLFSKNAPTWPPMAPLRRLLMLLVLLSLLAAALPLAPVRPRPTPTSSSERPPAAAMALSPLTAPPAASGPAAAAGLDTRALPADLAGLNELVDQRTMDSATFQLATDRYTTVISAAPLHYQDVLGQWQIINPAFRPTESSFVVEHNTVRSRAGLHSAWLSAAAENTIVTWQATALGTSSLDQAFTTLATPLAQPQRSAEQRQAGRVLHYAGGWSDPQLAEELISAAGSLEHLLVLASAPHANGSPAFLELRATLTLLPGATLWADGRQQLDAFRTAGRLEVRDTAGETTMVFEPVRAFEQGPAGRSVAGEYQLQATGKPGTWTVGVRTPWSWWTDPDRHYPAAIDPTITMEVMKTTGYSDALAWVGNGSAANPDTTDQSFQFGTLVLGSWNGSGSYRGYVQFNSLPHMLTSAPIAIEAAYLDVEPSSVRMPAYTFDADDFPDWEMYWVQTNATLYALGPCPGQCSGFSLRNQPQGFSWSSSIGAPLSLGAKPLVAPPPKTGGTTKTTSWDVTSQVQQWNTTRPADGPLFMLQLNTNCQHSSFNDANGAYVTDCTRFVVPSGGVRMRIAYEARPMNVGQAFLNRPGVPSYLKDVFKQGSTDHQYDLQDGSSAWRAVAARGNHALAEATPSRVGLKIMDYTSPEHIQPLLSNGATQSPADTAFALIDGHNNALGGADLGAAVTASNENDFAADGQRNYLVEHQQAAALTYSYGVSKTLQVSFNSGRLIQLREFALTQGDNVGIFTNAPAAIQLALAQPTSGGAKADALLSNLQLDSSFGPAGGQLRSVAMNSTPRSGTWALAMIHQGRPFPDSERPEFAGSYHFSVTLLICPQGDMPTKKWGCQPVRLPRPAGPPQYPSRTALGLTIYSPGGFNSSPPAPFVWCTANEGQGMPIVQSAAGGRWVAVGQGRVCWNGTTLSTTPDSGIALAYKIPGDPYGPNDPRGTMPPTYIYGDTMIIPVPASATGVTTLSGSNGRLSPTPTTRRNIEPFAAYWSSVYAHSSDYISTAEMHAVGDGTVNAQVTVDAAAGVTPIDWRVTWTLYPDETADPDYYYAFEATTTQDQPLHSSASFVSLASLELRVLQGTVATGIIKQLDSFKTSTGVMAMQFHADRGKITQAPQLGGATKNIQVVVQPPGLSRLPDNIESCPGAGGSPSSCLDLRLDTYSWSNGDGDKVVQLWELPDAHIVDNVGMLAVSTPGKLSLYSNDQPNALQRASAVDEAFTFDTWGASVSIKEQECYPGSGIVTVVRGTASIALPMFGDDGSSGTPPTQPPSIMASFTLCQGKLYSTTLELNIDPNTIPVGASGLGVYLIGGTITLNPDFTRIELKLGFQTLDGTTLSDGLGTVTIDTRGMFSLEASATIVAELDAHLLLQVAWNPLDVLLEAEISCCSKLITGALHLHGWIGQGWQNKYSWLPPDEDFHFSGSIQATLFIPEGYIADLGPMELPPFDFSIGLKIAFGEFCTSVTCSEYAWGMSVAFTIFDVDVGFYVDTTGPEFILGTDDHVLIDQFAPAQQKAAAVSAPAAPPPVITPGNWQPLLVKPIKTPVDDWPHQPASVTCMLANPAIHSCPFNVQPNVGRALFAAGWQNGNLNISLIKPDNTPITQSNAAFHGVLITSSATDQGQQITFSVKPMPGSTSIMAGQWKLQIGNVGGAELLPNVANNYHLLFASDPPPPTLAWSAPLGAGTTPAANGLVNLAWQAKRGSQAVADDVKIELAYVPAATRPVTPDLYLGTLIANRLSANQGGYAWDTRGLASGEYAIVARIEDHLHGNGSVVAWAPGTVIINDTTPPPVPQLLATLPAKDALLLIWAKDTATPDLAGYLVEYRIPNWDAGTQLQRVRKLLPGRSPFFERVRLGGLLNGLPTTYCVRAYDASGNLSTCTPIEIRLPLTPPGRIGKPTGASGRVTSDTAGAPALSVAWSAPPASRGQPAPAGYILSYRPVGCLLPAVQLVASQGRSPIDVQNTTSFLLTGLTPGQTYEIAIQAYTSTPGTQPVLSDIGLAETIALLVADPGDGDGDGLSDHWQQAYGVTGAAADPDRDGLTNQQEYTARSHPTTADSDKDGYYDGEETDSANQRCSPEHPAYHTQPRLMLTGKSRMTFKVAANRPAASPQTIRIFNFGAGELNWTARASFSWITLSSSTGVGSAALDIAIDPSGLAPGHYEGSVVITTSSAASLAAPSAVQSEVATLEVVLEVLPLKQSTLFLPVLHR